MDLGRDLPRPGVIGRSSLGLPFLSLSSGRPHRLIFAAREASAVSDARHHTLNKIGLLVSTSHCLLVDCGENRVV